MSCDGVLCPIFCCTTISTYWSQVDVRVKLKNVFTLSRPPFTAYNQKELAEKIREGKFRRIPYRFSDQLNELLTKMLHLKVRMIEVQRYAAACGSSSSYWEASEPFMFLNLGRTAFLGRPCNASLVGAVATKSM